jgi:F-type H+-transporting ATPase subunit a
MKGSEILDIKPWKLSWLGLEHPFFTVNSTTVIYTWIILGFIILLALFVRLSLKKKDSIVRFIATEFIASFLDMCQQTLGTAFTFSHFVFIMSLFVFILLCNIIMIIPWMGEPTKDLNTTLALGIITFIYTQIHAISAHGLGSYIKEYFEPFFIMFPLHVLGKIASVVSIAFRLFGNIFGGAIISHIYFGALEGNIIWESLGLLSGCNFLIVIFFGLFEGFLQAFVFTMLALTYLSIALTAEPEDTLA